HLRSGRTSRVRSRTIFLVRADTETPIRIAIPTSEPRPPTASGNRPTIVSHPNRKAGYPMAGRILNRRELRDQADEAERRQVAEPVAADAVVEEGEVAPKKKRA